MGVHFIRKAFIRAGRRRHPKTGFLRLGCRSRRIAVASRQLHCFKRQTVNEHQQTHWQALKYQTMTVI